MNKKILLLVIICILIMPFNASIAVKNDYQRLGNSDLNQSNVTEDIVSMINEVNEQHLYQYLNKFVSFGYKPTGSDNAHETADWIKSEFDKIGLITEFQEWKYLRYQDKNVIGVHPGVDPDYDAVIVVIAHYDTIGESPGANDDGSGIAAMLTIANIISQYDFKQTIRFIAVSGEEVGTFGSFADAKNSYRNNENIIGVINIDTIGYVNNEEDGHILQMFANDHSRNLINFGIETAKKYEEYTEITLQYCTNYPADCESYYDYGFDGIQFIQPKPELYQWMHTPEDTLDKINFSYLVKTTKILLAITCELAIKPIDIQIRIIKPYEGYYYLRNIPILKLPFFNNYFSSKRAITYIYGKTSVEININTNEKINSVYYAIDGYTRHVNNNPPYEYRIGGGDYGFYKLKGHHDLSVCVTTNTGKTAYDSMDNICCKKIMIINMDKLKSSIN